MAKSQEETTIYWNGLCGSSSLDWAFWSTQLTLNTDDPDFTLCFQYTILHWLSCGFLFLTAPFYVNYLMSRSSKFGGKISMFNVLKCILITPMLLLMALDFFRAISDSSSGLNPPVILFLYPIIMLIALSYVMFITFYEYRKQIHTSGVLFLFWMILMLTSIVIIRSKSRYNNLGLPNFSEFRLVTWSIFFACTCIQFILQLFSDKSALQQENDFSSGESRLLLSSSLQTKNDNEGTKAYMKPFLKKEMTPCPELSSSFLSQISFYWLCSMIIKGYRRTLTGDDLWALLDRDTCDHIFSRVDKHWEEEAQKSSRIDSVKYSKGTSNGTVYGNPSYQNSDKTKTKLTEEKHKPSFLKVITKVFGWPYAIAGVWKLVYDLINFVQPQLLSLLILFIQTKDPYVWRGYVLSFALFAVAFFKTYIFQQYYHGAYVTGMRLRTAVISTVYRKALLLSSSSRKVTTVGEIVNLMSVDAQKLQDAPAFLHQLWGAPLIIALALYFLWLQLGPSVLAGLVVMLLLVPVNLIIAGRIRKLQIGQMKWKDQRIKLMSEILNGIKVLKLYAWETYFNKGVSKYRESELILLRSAAYLNAGSAVTWFCAPFLVALSTFAVYVLSSPDNVLDANKAFVSLSLFNILNMPLTLLPGSISYVVTCMVSLKRITRFLNLEEIDATAVDTSGEGTEAREYPIQIEKASFQWGVTDDKVLKNIDFKVPAGKLVAVVGNVGSGKTTLVSAMLGELHKSDGRVSLTGSVAYVPQQAWCQNATLTDNITFGKNLIKNKFDKVISACALGPDIKILPGGLNTEIGEKGINLSGGQKQRISLARAVYADADVYLMDDPLSAVDAHVGKHIFEQVIGPTGLLSNKTRVLVTNAITFLPKMDTIIVLKDNTVSEIGTYDELIKQNGGFSEFIQQYLDEAEDDEDLDPETDGEELELRAQLRRTISIMSGGEESEGSILKSGSYTRQLSRRTSKVSGIRRRSTVEEIPKQNVLIQEETAETGSVQMSVFLSYVKAYDVMTFIITVVTYASYIACTVGQNLWLSEWSQDSTRGGNTTLAEENALRDLRLGVYGAIGFGQAVFVLLQNFGIAFGTYQASKYLHNDILNNVMKAPLAFFDTTPIGRLINRFGKDIDTVDITIPLTLRIWLMTFAGVMGTIIIIAITLREYIFVFIPLLVLYYFAQRFYISTSRQLKRIDSVRRSPIYSHFQESIMGAPSIRAYRRQQTFIDKSDYLVDWNQMAWYPNIVSNRWLQITLEGIGNFIILFTAIFAVLSRDFINAGLVGLSVSYALQVTGSLNYVVRMTCDLENYIVAVERLKEYTEIENEAPWTNDARKPDSSWPAEGQVVFKDYSVRYRAGLDCVLKGINAKLNAGEKIGIVGRTGAGKSSLTLALFRILEAAGGKIEIDNIDISTLGLHDLRSRLTIIPQDPVLFSGSLRYNIDPSETRSDTDIWRSLELAHLKSFVASQNGGLDFVCSEGGENLSVGQRQLVCLARALLRKTKILILDEATAAIDMETDDLIQQTIRKEFKDCSVLTIAHRLNTIIDYDKILVLDKGLVKEYDNPKNLLSDSKSIFYGMALDAGLI